jgi:hypothetical protein
MICEFVRHEFGILILFRAILTLTVSVSVLAVAFRASSNNWDFSFLWKSFSTFELLSWRKYGFFSATLIFLLAVSVVVFLFFPSIHRYCSV